MTDPYVAALRRKYEACQEPAKRAELAHALMLAGVDVNAVAAVSEPVRAKSKVPEGRSTKPLVTATPTKPITTTAVAPETTEVSKETEAKPSVTKRSPGRPRKTETVKKED
jgi:hypothetical protein